MKFIKKTFNILNLVHYVVDAALIGLYYSLRYGSGGVEGITFLQMTGEFLAVLFVVDTTVHYIFENFLGWEG